MVRDALEGLVSVNPVMLTPHLDGAGIGGTERQCLLLCRELARAGSEPWIMTLGTLGRPRRTPAGEIPVERVVSPVPALVRTFKQRRRALRGTAAAAGDGEPPAVGPAHSVVSIFSHRIPTWFEERAIYRALCRRRADFDLIHLHGFFWVPMLRIAARAARDLSVPLVVKVTNDAERTWPILLSAPGGVEALSRASALVTVSRAAHDFFQALRLGPIVELIPNGVQLPDAPPSDGREGVLFVGSLKRQKGVDVLIRAWAEIAPSAGRLTIVGDGTERSTLERMVREVGLGHAVRFAGEATDVHSFLSRAACFVLPSRWEGMPNALLEAMAHGLPCIATAVPGSLDLIKDAETGLLVPPDDPASLAKSIRRLLGAPGLAADLGRAARRRIEAEFSVGIAADRHMQLYRRLLAGVRS